MDIPNHVNPILIAYSTLSQKYPFTFLFLLSFVYAIMAVIMGCYLRSESQNQLLESIKKAHFYWALGITISCIILALASLSLAIVEVVQFPHGLLDSWGLVSVLHLLSNIIIQSFTKPMWDSLSSQDGGDGTSSTRGLTASYFEP
jgi:hypothetical protein